MEEIAKDIYSILRPAIVAWIIALSAWGITKLLDEDVKSMLKGTVRELVSIFNKRGTLKALNAYLFTALLVLLIAFAWLGQAVLPSPDENTSALELAVLIWGAHGVYVLMFTVGIILCVKYTMFERE